MVTGTQTGLQLTLLGQIIYVLVHTYYTLDLLPKHFHVLEHFKGASRPTGPQDPIIQAEHTHKGRMRLGGDGARL